MAKAFFIAGTVPYIVAGVGHAVLAVLDTFRPRYFKPTNEAATAAMKESGIGLRVILPGSHVTPPNVWDAWLGFNVSHGLGLAAFGLLLLAIALHDFDLVTEIEVLRPLTVIVSAIYLVSALRYWYFYGPLLVTVTGFACFTVSYLAT